MPRILVVEDEAEMREGLRFNLEGEGHRVELAVDGPTGLERARRGEIDLILLDVMLPGMSGIDVLRTLRGEGVTTPVLMLTARGLEMDKVQGLKLGADDYVTKPFSIDELGARIEALLRRSRPEAPVLDAAGAFRFADVEVDLALRTVSKSGRRVQLSFKEFELLKLFIHRQGQVVSRSEILDEVWGYDESQLRSTRTVDTHVANLRRKLEDGGERGRYLRTVHKVGYRFTADGSE